MVVTLKFSRKIPQGDHSMKISCVVMTVVILLSLYVWATPNLDGTWSKACQDVDGDYVSSSLKISKAQWNVTHWGYEDENCAAKYLQFDLSYSAVMTEQNLDLKLADAAYTPMTDEVAEALNEGEFCGFTNWKKNKKTSIIGKECSDVDNYEKNQMVYSIYKNQTNQLWLGEASASHEGITPDSRHTSLEAIAYKKGN